jgi:hypothetical protein
MLGRFDAAARRQLWLLALLIVTYLLAAVGYVYLAPQFAATGAGIPGTSLTRGQLALANGAIILVLYSAVALAGWWLAARVQIPAIAAPTLTLGRWLRGPLLTGALAGVIMVVFEQVMQRWFAAPSIPHPEFPSSLLASYSAAVGEEVIFRLFLLSLWALLWTQALKHFSPSARTRVYALAIANGIAAVSFALAHLGSAMVLFGVTSPAELAGVTLVELLVLNAIIGLVAGQSFIRHGLVAAAGVHLGADLIWHVVYGLLV